jgi:hypothetical protein
VLLAAVYYRANLAMRQLAPLFGVSPATVRRTGPSGSARCSRATRTDR